MEQEIVQHSLKIDKREKTEISGIKDVEYFNENEILAVSTMGNILLKGKHLHIDCLNTETQVMNVSGTVCAVIYSENRSDKKSFLDRIFR